MGTQNIPGLLGLIFVGSVNWDSFNKIVKRFVGM